MRHGSPRFTSPGAAVAVVAVTAAGIMPAFAPGSPATGEASAAVLVLGAVHALLGTAGIHLVERRGLRALLYLHFAVALAVAVAALIASRGSGFLMVLSLVSQSVLNLSGPGAFGVTATCAATMFAIVIGEGGWTAESASQIIGAASSTAFVVAFSAMLLRQRRARAEVERLAAELGEANRQLLARERDVEELATTKERNRIAREIHDGLGHYLTVVHVQLEAAQATLGRDPATAQRSIARAQEQTREGLDEVRRSVSVLRGSTRGRAPAGSLLRALERLVDECAADGLEARVEVQGEPRPLPDDVAFTLHRAAQEALTNVRRHARASTIHVELAFVAANGVRLRVKDDGVGIADRDERPGFGLVGLRERAESCGGRVVVSAERGGGFLLEVELPA